MRVPTFSRSEVCEFLIIFNGATDRLIPLFAVGAFLAFTLSQPGMVQHWRRAGGRGARFSMLINGAGAIATGITLCIIVAAKFTEGAWITVLIIPALIVMMFSIRRHYRTIQQQTAKNSLLNLQGIRPPWSWYRSSIGARSPKRRSDLRIRFRKIFKRYTSP